MIKEIKRTIRSLVLIIVITTLWFIIPVLFLPVSAWNLFDAITIIPMLLSCFIIIYINCKQNLKDLKDEEKE